LQPKRKPNSNLLQEKEIRLNQDQKEQQRKRRRRKQRRRMRRREGRAGNSPLQKRKLINTT